MKVRACVRYLCVRVNVSLIACQCAYAHVCMRVCLRVCVLCVCVYVCMCVVFSDMHILLVFVLFKKYLAFLQPAH